MANPALLLLNLHLFKVLLLPPPHQSSLKSLIPCLSHHLSTSHIKRSYSNDFKTYPLKDIQHQQQTLTNDQKSNSQRITTKNLFGRLQLLKIDEKLQPIIVTEQGRILQQMRNNSNPLAREPSEMSEPKSEPIPPLEFIYHQQSRLTSPTAPITMFNSEESFATAPSSPEHPAPPTDDPPLLPIPPPTMLQARGMHRKKHGYHLVFHV